MEAMAQISKTSNLKNAVVLHSIAFSNVSICPDVSRAYMRVIENLLYFPLSDDWVVSQIELRWFFKIKLHHTSRDSIHISIWLKNLCISLLEYSIKFTILCIIIASIVKTFLYISFLYLIRRIICNNCNSSDFNRIMRRRKLFYVLCLNVK